MILAWLGMGMFGTDEAFKSVGLGLFAFAFILGFSIDVFFDLLDRLVGISRALSGRSARLLPTRLQVFQRAAAARQVAEWAP